MATPPREILIFVLYCLICLNRAVGIRGYTRRPLNGYFCGQGFYSFMGQIDQEGCTRLCIISDNCASLMYNIPNKACMYQQGLEPCHLATPNPAMMLMRFRPSLQERCLIPSDLFDHRLVRTDSGGTRVLSRKYENGAICLGVSDYIANSTFHFTGPEDPTVCPDVAMEIMAIDTSCTVAWVTYSAGDVLPRGAIVMGFWNGKPSYSTRHLFGPEQTFGWYVEGSDVATYNSLGHHNDTTFDILISV